MKVGAIINRHAGWGRGDSSKREVESSFARHGIEAEVVAARSQEIKARAERFVDAGVDLLVAGGGDGTVSTVAETCVKHGLPLGVLPLGTRNHFGKDLGLPGTLEESIACIAAGKTTRVDVASVNGRVFINNSSIGAYPRAVEQREELRFRFRLRKYVAGMIATLRTFAQHPMVNATVEMDGETFRCAGPFVFVGNNVYTVQLFTVSRRSSLRDGRLCIYTTRANGVSGLFRLLGLSMLGRLEQARDFEMHCGKSATIRLPKEEVRVSKDGEVLRLRTPLHYTILPEALEVFAPAS